MNDTRKITAIVRAERLESIERQLQAMQVDGITVTRVKGFGEWNPQHFFGYADFVARLPGHICLELFVDAARADEVVEAIASAAFTGYAGDGVIAVLPVERCIHIRSHCQRQEKGRRSADAGG